MKTILKKVFNFFGYLVVKAPDIKANQLIYLKYKDFTMIPEDLYLGNLKLVETFVKKVDGDIIECGVWRGGMTAGIAEFLGDNRRYYELFDSFEGLPAAKDIDGTAALNWQQNTEGYNYYNNCKAEIEFAERAMCQTNSKYSIHKGWFSETLPGFKPKRPIALLRLDGDWYESTLECLSHLFKYVNYGGIIIMDDYYTWDGCSKAVHDFLSSIKSSSKISHSPEGICYIIKLDKFEN